MKLMQPFHSLYIVFIKNPRKQLLICMHLSELHVLTHLFYKNFFKMLIR